MSGMTVARSWCFGEADKRVARKLSAESKRERRKASISIFLHSQVID
jgi:hypothetical protein